jgi:predicted nicotinamide N-methyase
MSSKKTNTSLPDTSSASQQQHVSYQFQYRKCGKSCTKCDTGKGHGPYWYAYWREGGKVHSRYIGKHPPAGVTVPQKSNAPETTSALRC